MKPMIGYICGGFVVENQLGYGGTERGELKKPHKSLGGTMKEVAAIQEIDVGKTPLGVLATGYDNAFCFVVVRPMNEIDYNKLIKTDKFNTQSN